jgi:GAF domain-containing protein
MTAPPDDTTTDPPSIVATLQQRLDAALAREAALAQELAARDAALAQRDSAFGERIDHQAATLDVLRAMSASPGDPQPVFDLIVDRARKLCDSYSVALYQYDGTLVHFSAFSKPAPPTQDGLAYVAMFPMPPTRSSIACRAILDGEIIHIRDMRADPNLSPAVRALDLGSNLAIPLIRDGKVIGTFNLNSKEAGGFSDRQVALLQTFAEQAVIAISSAETYRGLGEALEQQTATAEVLQAISRSTFDLQPVLAMVAETAAKLCLADHAMFIRREGDRFRLTVNFGFPPEYEAHFRKV